MNPDPDNDDITGATGGIWVVARDFTSGDTFATNTDLIPFTLTDTEWAGKEFQANGYYVGGDIVSCLLYTSPSPRDS